MIRMCVALSIPSILSQLAMVLMEYIDTSMVGHLGANPSASIGLVATTTWLFMGLCAACSTGFSVQVAHLLGAGQLIKARSVLRQALTASLIFGIIIGIIGFAISGSLPRWLGGGEPIREGATLYFLIFAVSLPIMQLNYLANGMLRCSGNMLFPGIMGLAMCVLDVVFNFFLIFPDRELSISGYTINVPGFGFGVWGAALGTSLAMLVVTVILWIYIGGAKSEIRLAGEKGNFLPQLATLRNAIRIGTPMGLERFITSAAQIVLTIIVAPLGAFAIAANAFAVTAEGLCYMPGYGISDAAVALVGQSLGAGKKALARRFAVVTIIIGIVVMSVMGAVMYVFAPELMGTMSPVKEIVDLGVMALRIEAWAEPMFAASIVAYGVFVGAGSSFAACVMNLGSMWGVRITLAALLAPVMGLKGVWLAMCIELCFRGMIFLLRVRTKGWSESEPRIATAN